MLPSFLPNEPEFRITTCNISATRQSALFWFIQKPSTESYHVLFLFTTTNTENLNHSKSIYTSIWGRISCWSSLMMHFLFDNYRLFIIEGIFFNLKEEQ